MVLDEGIRPRDLYDRLRGIADGEPLIQVNHGREGELGGEASFFDALGLSFDEPLAYDPMKPMTQHPNSLLLAPNANGTRDIDFDAMELLNGPDYGSYLLLRNDWFSLLNQGFIKTATANSDTHIKSGLPGYPRNYILLDNMDGERDEATLVEQVRKQKVFGTTGPIIRLNINGEATIGDIISVKDGNIDLNIQVLAADWVPLDQVRVFVNGRETNVFKTNTQSEMVRFDRSIPLTLTADTWFVVETSASNPSGSPILEPQAGLYNIIAPGFVPLAFTNPIFIDADGNGRYDPPGIPSPESTPDFRVTTRTLILLALIAAFLVFRLFRHMRVQR
jgi:hypothetical protein